MKQRRIVQCLALLLMLLPAAAYADTYDLTGGTWSLSGDSLILKGGTTTINTGNLGFWVPLAGSGSYGSVSTGSFSCSNCLASTEYLSGFYTNDTDIFASGSIIDGGITGGFSAELADPYGFFSTSGSIESGSLTLNLPTAPTPEPSTWLLLLTGIALFGTAAIARKKGWLPEIAGQTHQA